MNHPLALVCYNRPRHLAQVLDALAEIKPEPLYVFSDGPKDEADAGRVKEVRTLLLGIRWTAPVITVKSENAGLARSVVGAVDCVLGNHETIIVLEDDCVPGPYFVDFMAACLEKYRDDDRVMSVSGYGYPLPPGTFDGYGWDAFFFPRIESWCWATWRRAWRHYVRDGDLAARFEEAQRAGVDLEAGGRDVPGLIRSKLKRGRDWWTPGWLLGTAMADGLTVYPVKSHARYIGADGSGANMGASGKWDVPISAQGSWRLPDDAEIYPPACEAMRELFGGS